MNWARRRLSPGFISGGNISFPPRLTFLFLAMLVQILAESLYWIVGRDGNLVTVSLAVSLWLVWFVLIILMAIPSIDNLLHRIRRALYIGTVVMLVALALCAIGEIVGIHVLNSGVEVENELTDDVTRYFKYNDATALAHQASEQLLNGENPYAEADIVNALEDMDLPASTATPLRQGDFAEVFPYPTESQFDNVLSRAKASGDPRPAEFESKISYPAGSFLFQTPFIAMGLRDVRIFYLLCAIATGAIILYWAPPRLRLLALCAILVSLELWNLVATGTTDTLYVLFVLLGWIMRRRLWVAALFMGLAASTKQIAWLYVLFYLILVLRETGWRPALKSLGGIGAVFLAINLPFIFGAPQHWLEGVAAPILDPMFPRGVGIVAFSLAGILPPNAAIFTAMEIAALAVAAIWYYRTGYRYPQVGLILAVLPFFFAWRSYSCYFYFGSLLVFGAVVALEYGRAGRGAVHPQPAA